MPLSLTACLSTARSTQEKEATTSKSGASAEKGKVGRGAKAKHISEELVSFCHQLFPLALFLQLARTDAQCANFKSFLHRQIKPGSRQMKVLFEDPMSG